MAKKTSKIDLKALADAVGKKEHKKGFSPLTDDIYNKTKDNKV